MDPMGLRSAFVMVGLLTVVVVGCEEKDSGQIVTTVPESKPINDLDPGQEQDLCEDVQAWAQDHLTDELFQRIECIGDAVSAATEAGNGVDEAACRSAYNECLSQPAERVIDFDAAQCNVDAFPMCDVTVGEYLTCAEDSYALLQEVLGLFDCSNLQALANADQQQLPASCMALEENCPGFYGNTEDPPPPPEG
jgi:hypothetical protein